VLSVSPVSDDILLLFHFRTAQQDCFFLELTEVGESVWVVLEQVTGDTADCDTVSVGNANCHLNCGIKFCAYCD